MDQTMKAKFTSVASVGARLLLLCATYVTPGTETSSAASAQEQPAYQYFTDRRPLKLETERVAILQAGTSGAEGPGHALLKFGLTAEQTQALPIAGWSL